MAQQCAYGVHTMPRGSNRCACGKFRDDPAERQWHTDTGHCGGCGQPDGYCTCNGVCGCHELHPTRDPDALDRYVAAGPDQDGLF